MWVPLLALILGFVTLVWSADRFLSGAASTATHLGVSKLLIGLTVVSLGTSAPEILVALAAAIDGNALLAVGNAIGSNIANIGLILGITALFMPVPVARIIIRLDAPIMLGVSLLACLTLLDGRISRGEGVMLAIGIGLYVWLTYRLGKKDPEAVRLELEREHEHGLELEAPEEPANAWRNALLIVLGLGGLLIGSRLVVIGAMDVAHALGVPAALISLTLVAFGTSLPELAACITAARRGESEIALGNVVGSNVFNLLSVLGFAAIVRPLSAPGDIGTHLLVMLAFSGAVIVVSGRGRVGRLSGLVLFAAYLAYVIVAYARNAGT